MCLAVLPVCTTPIDLVCKNTLRIMTISRSVGFHSALKDLGFVVRIEGNLLNSPHAVFVQAEIKLDPEFHWCFDFSADNRPDVWLRDAHDAVLHTVGLLIEHIFLLFVDLPDGTQLLFFFLLQPVSFCKVPVDISEIPFYKAELPADNPPDFLRTALFALRKIQVVLSCNPAVSSGAMFAILSADPCDDLLKIFPCLIQQGKVLRETDIGRSTGRIEDQGSLIVWLFFCFGAVRFPVRGVGRKIGLTRFGSTGAAGRMVLVVGVLLFVLRLFLSFFRFGFALFQKLLVHEDGHVDIEPLPEGDQSSRIKRGNLLISRQADEVLKIRIFRDLFYEFLVGEAEFLLDNQSTEGHAAGLRHISKRTCEARCVTGFILIPRDQLCKPDPAVVGIHMEAKRLVKIKERRV